MAQKRPNLVQNMHFWSFWAKYCHFLHILSNVQPKTNVNKVPRWVFRMWVTKLLISPVKIRIFCPKKPNLARKWHFCSFWARPCRLIWLVVVARRLYLARHQFTLCLFMYFLQCDPNIERSSFSSSHLPSPSDLARCLGFLSENCSLPTPGCFCSNQHYNHDDHD